MKTQYQKGDHVEVIVLNHRMTGTVVGHRMIDDEDEVLTEIALDTPRASTVRVLPYKIVGQTDQILDGSGPADPDLWRQFPSNL